MQLSDRRRPPLRALHQPEEPVLLRASIGRRQVVERGTVVEFTDRTMVVEVHDAAMALALSLSPGIEVEVDLGGGPTTLLAEPGRRASDNPTSRRVELVLRDVA